MMKRILLFFGMSTICLAIASGCKENKSPVPASIEVTNSMPPSPKSDATASSANSPDEHSHQSGQHGGIIVSLGRESYHIEAVFDADGIVRLFTLGSDETRVIDIEMQKLNGFVKVEGSSQSEPLVFEPAPQDGDKQNRSSQWIGKLPEAMVGKSLEITVPNITIDGERFRLGIQSVDHPTNSEGMPSKVVDSEEQELYLKPGGRYTQADIDANGKTTPTVKFKGIKSSHDMFPKVGDKICPITETKANPKFVWIVDGESYSFCCPPCIDEFVKQAKSAKDPIPKPDTYVKN